jgi:hypothetical protein
VDITANELIGRATSAAALPDRVCAWAVTADDGVFSPALTVGVAETPIAPRFDGELTLKRAKATMTPGGSTILTLKGLVTNGKVALLVGIPQGPDKCASAVNRGTGKHRTFACLIGHRFRRSFKVKAFYVTGLNVQRSLGTITVKAPRR